MKKELLLLLLLLTITSYSATAQERFTFNDISRYSIYTVDVKLISVPDYNAEYRRPMYKAKYNESTDNFISEYEKWITRLEGNKLSNEKLSKNEKKLIKQELKVLLEEYHPIYEVLKRKNMGLTHFRDIDYNSPHLLEATKKELIKLKGELLKLEHVSEHEFKTKLPQKKVNLKVITYFDDVSKIKGEYFIADLIKVAPTNNYEDKTYENEVIDNGRNVSVYDTYKYFKSVDGTGVISITAILI